MITNLKIENFKSIASQELAFKPVTILTGTNSSGKSSVIQSVLFYSYYVNNNLYLEDYLGSFGVTNELLNLKTQKEQIKITPSIDNKKLPALILDSNNNQWKELKKSKFPTFEKDLFHLCANRIGQEDIAKKHKTLRSGSNGEYLFGFYADNKNNALKNNKLISHKDSDSLSMQVRFWLEEILELKIAPITEEIDNNHIKVSYKNYELGVEFSPFNLGAGVSYLTKILILGLSLEQNNVLMVENPEVHLHPKAISKLSNFFVFLANAGTQVIIETHSEHILNKMRWAIVKEKLSEQDVQIYYRDHIENNFISLKINKRSKYTNQDDKIVKFPKGFFDSDLDELLDMM